MRASAIRAALVMRIGDLFDRAPSSSPDLTSPVAVINGVTVRRVGLAQGVAFGVYSGGNLVMWGTFIPRPRPFVTCEANVDLWKRGGWEDRLLGGWAPPWKAANRGSSGKALPAR